MSKCLTRFFHYVIIQYILFPVLRKYISFALARYALGNCFSSIILTTWVLTAPDSLGKAPAVPTNTFFSLRLPCLSSIMSCPERTSYLGCFLPLPMEIWCQDMIYDADSEYLQKAISLSLLCRKVQSWFSG